MDLSALQLLLAQLDQPPYRFRQICQNYYSGKYQTFDQMTNISKDLRSKLEQSLSLYSVSQTELVNSVDSQKAILSLSDGLRIETVLMNYHGWYTACVSSQVGCSLNCSFCATGKMGFKRNLTSEEIVDQIIYWNLKLSPQYVGRVVFMGMGEPFLNYYPVIDSLKLINLKDGLNIGQRKISLSTAGIAPQIRQFADLNTQVNLAVSLHSADQTVRQSIMPIAQEYSLADLKSALEYYVDKTHRQVFFEYALIQDVNDTPDQLKKIIAFIKSHKLFYLNIIPLNPIKNGLIPSSQLNFNKFISGLDRANLDYSVRRTLGQPISSACGQLIT